MLVEISSVLLFRCGKSTNPRHVLNQLFKSQILIDIFGTDLMVMKRPLVILYPRSPGPSPQAASDILDESDVLDEIGIHVEWLHGRYRTSTGFRGTKEG